MKFVSLITTVTSTLGLADIATAAVSSPAGGYCAFKNQYECGNNPGYNNNNDFAFYCTSANVVAKVQNCDCSRCCAISEKGASC
ncbi:hypothetical protein K503DRAFT_775893 [Rhizopogon vinicolor AM-OR11-026]|uniref:Uncharacterized protein n=1 Tax=Rhizopogon vinicolor AM-OR11-026 TaxID=1314800 RepID=A0A1B7MKP5_9AGAM|nr:hypothetical protein K503DRAFT_775893 [Rhizopogon vinicolor AM-OR11-026]